MQEDRRIIQIAPAAAGWRILSQFRGDLDTRALEDIACWGLLADGTVVPLIAGTHRLNNQWPDVDYEMQIYAPGQLIGYPHGRET